MSQSDMAEIFCDQCKTRIIGSGKNPNDAWRNAYNLFIEGHAHTIDASTPEGLQALFDYLEKKLPGVSFQY